MKTLKTFLYILLCSLILPFSSFAKENQLVAKYDRVSQKYFIDITDPLFEIENLEDGENYSFTILFKNTTYKRLNISLFDVENMLPDARLYDLSKMTFRDEKNVLYEGEMDGAKFHFSLYPNEERMLTCTYRIDDFEHKPDNSLMHAKMHARFHFVGTFETIKDSHVVGEGYKPPTSTGPTVPSTEESSGGDETVKKPTITVTIPKTGDDFPLLWVLLFIGISSVSLIIINNNKQQ